MAAFYLRQHGSRRRGELVSGISLMILGRVPDEHTTLWFLFTASKGNSKETQGKVP